MGGQGRGVESRDQRTAETQQSGTARHQGGTGNVFVATGVMDNQGEGRGQEGNAVSSTKDRRKCEGLPEHERRHQKRVYRVGRDRLESGSVG
eukprot:9096625-Heterocapsa_arctica.AAC.1